MGVTARDPAQQDDAPAFRHIAALLEHAQTPPRLEVEGQSVPVPAALVDLLIRAARALGAQTTAEARAAALDELVRLSEEDSLYTATAARPRKWRRVGGPAPRPAAPAAQAGHRS